jgi:hypothetical protein
VRVEQFFDAEQNTQKLQEQILEYARPARRFELRGAKARAT